MNNEIKKLLITAKEEAISIKKEREIKENELLKSILQKTETYSILFNRFIFEMVNEGVIDLKKRFVNGKYKEVQDNEIYSTEFCKTSVTVNPFYPKEGFISIELNAFNINSLDYINKDSNDFKEPLNKLHQGIKSTVDRETLKAIAKYNKENTSSQIILLPYSWNTKDNYNAFGHHYSNFSNFDFCLLQTNDFKKLGFEVGITAERTIEFVMRMSKLETTINNVANEKKLDYKIDVINCIKPITDFLNKYEKKEEIKQALIEECKKNFELVSLKIYENLIYKYKNAKEIYKDVDIATSIRIANLEHDEIEEKKLYNDYIETSSYDEDTNNIIYVWVYDDNNDKLGTEGRFIPILLDDLKELAKELNGKITEPNPNYYNINVNAVKFENMLISFSDESENHKTK